MSLLRYYSDILVPLFVTVHTLTLATTVTKSRLSLSLPVSVCMSASSCAWHSAAKNLYPPTQVSLPYWLK